MPRQAVWVSDGLSRRVFNDRYRVEGELARGGMPTVYLDKDLVLDRTVALKVLSGDMSQDPGFVERFRREARAAAGLNHPNIVSVYDGGEADGAYFIVVELGVVIYDMVTGRPPFSGDTALSIAYQHARADPPAASGPEPCGLRVARRGRPARDGQGSRPALPIGRGAPGRTAGSCPGPNSGQAGQPGNTHGGSPGDAGPDARRRSSVQRHRIRWRRWRERRQRQPWRARKARRAGQTGGGPTGTEAGVGGQNGANG